MFGHLLRRLFHPNCSELVPCQVKDAFGSFAVKSIIVRLGHRRRLLATFLCGMAVMNVQRFDRLAEMPVQPLNEAEAANRPLTCSKSGSRTRAVPPI
jgi:hypothetical protein